MGRCRTDLSWMEVGGMTIPGRAHVVSLGQGRTVDLGVAHMRVLASGEATNGGAFALIEFSGTAEGAWTVPHLHRGFEESFFILDGLFTFTIGEEAIAASPGMYLLVPRGTPHTLSAAPGGGRFLLLMVPGGLEKMFFELAQLPPNAIRDPAARAAISARYDSIPV
jgi:quercetin dioxygenase-like cupin family protein